MYFFSYPINFALTILVFDEKMQLVENDELESTIEVELLKAYSIFRFLLAKLDYYDVKNERFDTYFLTKVNPFSIFQ